MGCGCGGSTRPPSVQAGGGAVVNQGQQVDVGQLMRDGGPGTASYVWSGPPRPPVTPAQP